MKRCLVLLACSGFLYVVGGCGQTPAPAPSNAPGTATEADHHHGEGPHGGTLADWGGGAYHVEFTVDHDKKEAAVYIIGSDAKSPVAIKADSIHLAINDPATDVDLVAKPLNGEAAGTSSRFVGTHDTLGIVKEFAGAISGEVEGTPYTGDFKEEAHGAGHKN